MTKKQVMSLGKELMGINVPEEVMVAIIRFCQSENPNFMKGRFRAFVSGQCGPNGEAIKEGK